MNQTLGPNIDVPQKHPKAGPSKYSLGTACLDKRSEGLETQKKFTRVFKKNHLEIPLLIEHTPRHPARPPTPLI